MHLNKEIALQLIRNALKEDIGKGDITTSAMLEKTHLSRAVVMAKQECIVCGITIAEWVITEVDASVAFRPNCAEGANVVSGKDIAVIEGSTVSILRAERTMLNLISFLSGIATKTAIFADRIKPYGVKLMDTRKTLPLLRYLEKYAISVGGGYNHRMGLYDQVLIKDNHIKAWKGPGKKEKTLEDLVKIARRKSLKGVKIEIEVANTAEFTDALQGRPDIIMLDNMTVPDVKACVEIRKFSKIKPLLEVSGGITLETVEDYARTGVDMISVGSLTASIDPIDLSLEII